MRIVFASSNKGKTEELQHYFAKTGIELLSQSAFNIPDADETATTLVENALIKAHQATKLSGLPAIADDSGLVVPALQGDPGVYSARYAGPNATMDQNIDHLLHEMRDLPDEKRIGYFHCVIVYLAHAKDPTPLICHGMLQGTILHERRPGRQFGYDPVFYLPEYQLTMAEMSVETKNKMSHRGVALQQLFSHLKQMAL